MHPINYNRSEFSQRAVAPIEQLQSRESSTPIHSSTYRENLIERCALLIFQNTAHSQRSALQKIWIQFGLHIPVTLLDPLAEQAIHEQNYHLCVNLFLNYSDKINKNKTKLMNYLLTESSKKGDICLCRMLIDDGAELNNEITENIYDYFLKTKDQKDIQPFFARRPKEEEIEIYNKTESSSNWNVITDLQLYLSNKPIAVINLADFDFIQSSRPYGAVTEMYSDNLRFYHKISKQFIVLRTRISTERQLILTIEKIKKMFPYNVITSWILIGHGNDKAIGLSEHDFFTTHSIDVMKQIAQTLDEKRGTISLFGCCNAQGKHNIAQIFSSYSGGIPVSACSNDVLTRDVCIWKGDCYPALFPSFPNSPGGLVVYKNGRRILDEKQEIRSRL